MNLPLFKWLVLAAFLSGFVWLIGYVIDAARSLSTADQDLLDARAGGGPGAAPADIPTVDKLIADTPPS